MAKEFTDISSIKSELFAEISGHNVHHDHIESLCKRYRHRLQESGDELQRVKEFFSYFNSAKPTISNSYLYISITVTFIPPTIKVMNIAKFRKPRKLTDLDDNSMYFEQVRRPIPMPGKYDRGGMLHYIYVFESVEDAGILETAITLTFGGTDWKISEQMLDN